MTKKYDFFNIRIYQKLHFWLRKWCNRLSQRQRLIIIYSLSIAYIICSLAMIAQIFIAEEESQGLSFSVEKLVDNPIKKKSMHSKIDQINTYLTISQYE